MKIHIFADIKGRSGGCNRLYVISGGGGGSNMTRADIAPRADFINGLTLSAEKCRLE